jgi:hypothetical protein
MNVGKMFGSGMQPRCGQLCPHAPFKLAGSSFPNVKMPALPKYFSGLAGSGTSKKASRVGSQHATWDDDARPNRLVPTVTGLISDLGFTSCAPSA